jgi:hypothetical protein
MLYSSPRREGFAQFLHRLADVLGHLQGVGAGQLIDQDCRRVAAVAGGERLVILRPQLDPRDVAQVGDPAIVPCFHDNLLKLPRLRESPQGGDGVLKLRHALTGLAGREGRLADLPGCHLHVLLLQRGDDILRRQVACPQLLGV